MTGDELDQAIDAAVRAMVAAEPAAGMRHRVLRRIAAEDARPRAWRLAVALSAVLLCVAAAAFVLRRPALDAPATATAGLSQMVERRPEVRADPGPARPSARRDRLTPSTVTTPPPRPGRGPAADASRGGRAAQPTEAEKPSTVEIAPLEPLGAIGVRPLSHGAVEMDAITIAPILLEPLRVAALEPNDSSSTPPSTPR